MNKNVPNIISSFRIFLAIALLFACLFSNSDGSYFCLFLYLLAGISDILDGKIARKYNLSSKTGAALDLFADRLLTLCVIFGNLISFYQNHLFFIACFILIARDFVVSAIDSISTENITKSKFEALKIASQFLGFSLILAPQFEIYSEYSRKIGYKIIEFAAALSFITIIIYLGRLIKKTNP